MIVHIRMGFASNSVKCFCHWYPECHVAISKMEISSQGKCELFNTTVSMKGALETQMHIVLWMQWRSVFKYWNWECLCL